ncbi:ABC transporter ATP-binding protein [Comamonas endophytica]|uniref:ABC transporter ATP-binding protein n=1 Tax=Comamonas endophytica TaxID=2949090 RepID=A0ABY6G6G5_9BURK|nr:MULTISPECIES: ABC transporter ATP-binding protein [unclassified Acidovorax]MCD2511219.1 ABC transporter ATP-binding protein [Acidovorax sp. D4N7]UYG50615.1 ABC transporter ATP-binding protein [Acidovorax sp. 5MLIR]
MTLELIPPPTPLLDIRGLDIQFRGARGPIQAVRGLDLQVRHGETLALVGESGCGKSTTALSILRLLAPGAALRGSIRFDGRDILAMPPAELRALRGRDIAMVFQEPMTSLNPVHSIGAQIIETLRRHERLSAAAARQRAIELLELVRIPEPQRRIDDFPHHLSGGQRQRVMIAMAVACRPRLLVADEPTTALDVTVQAQILELLDGLRREFGMALLLITHDLGLVAQWADRVAVMYGGEKVEEAATAALFAQPAPSCAGHAYTRGLLGASLHAGHTLHYTAERLPEIRVRADEASGQREFTLHRPAAPAPRPPHARNAAPLLSVRDLRTSYPARQGHVVHAVDGVSFDIAPGETLGLVGESGCGKSTLSRTLLRLLQPTSGRIVLDGTDIVPLDARALKPWRRRIQMVFQDPYASLNPRRSVFDILDSVLRVHGVAQPGERRQRIAQMLKRVGLPADAAVRYPNEFSGGQRQRIGIARALIVRPALVVLDEPVSALDVSVQAQILNLLVELKEDFGLSYLFISHDLSVVRYFADRVMVMNQGRIVETGNHEEIWQRPQHAYTRSLIAAVPGAQHRQAA